MKMARRAAALVLAAVFLACLWPEALRAVPHDRQFRDAPDAAPCRRFPLGTDELGRDRLARLLYGTRVSVIAAAAAALLSTVLAAAFGGAAGFLGGTADTSVAALIDVMLSLPWLFLLVIVRAVLPLNTGPLASVVVTFGLIGGLGWPGAARVVRASCAALRRSDFAIEARACGLSRGRVLVRHILPHARPVLAAQFRAAIPIYILAEANLGLLGLGVSDPLPSWGNLLRPLEGAGAAGWAAWSPLLLMLVVVSCFYVSQPTEVLVR